MRDLGFAIILTALLPLGLVSAFVGVLLWVWVAMLSPNELLSGFLAGVPFNKIVAATTFMLVLFGREKKIFYFDKTVALLLLFALAATATWLGRLVPDDAGTDLYQKLIKEVVLALLIMSVMGSRHRLHMLVITIVIALSFIGVKEGLISALTAGGHKILGMMSVGDNNALATALLMIVPLIFYLIRYSAVHAVRLAMMGSLGLCLITVVMTFSRGGFLGLIILGAFIIKNSNKKFLSVLLVVAGGIAFYFLAPAALFDRLNTIKSAESDDSFMGRVVAWKISWLIAMDNPLFGGGPHAVQYTSTWRSYVPSLYKLDFVYTPPPDVVAHAAHSIYFEILGDMGFVGLTLFLLIIFIAFWNCFRIRRLCQKHPELAWANDLARMIQVSLAVYVTTAAALSMGYFELFYIIVAMTSCCRRTVELQLAHQTVGAKRDLIGGRKPLGVGPPGLAPGTLRGRSTG